MIKILSSSSYDGMRERLERQQKRIRALENSYQQLVLQCGLHGFEVIIKPEVPAQPARVVLKKVK